MIGVRDIAAKVKLNMYSALDLFDMIKTTNSSKYINSLDNMLQSTIGDKFGPCSTKILGLVVHRLEKLSANSPPLDKHIRCQMCRDVLHLAQSLLSSKGTLENEFC